MQTNQNQSAGDVHPAEIHEDYGSSTFVSLGSILSGESFSYFNAASCPDCGNGMVRQGGCLLCMTCGFSSCGCG